MTGQRHVGHWSAEFPADVAVLLDGDRDYPLLPAEPRIAGRGVARIAHHIPSAVDSGPRDALVFQPVLNGVFGLPLGVRVDGGERYPQRRDAPTASPPTTGMAIVLLVAFALAMR